MRSHTAYTQAVSEWPVWKKLGALTGFAALIGIYAPILWLMIMSVSGDPLSGIPGPFTGAWYGALLGNTTWLKPLGLSVALGLAVAFTCMVCATVVGRAIPRIRHGKGAILAVALFPLMIPGVVVGTALFLYFRVLLGLKMGMWSLFAGHLVWSFPFALLAVLVVALRFDTRLLESGADLGASAWQRFRDIEFPLLKDGIISGGLFAFLLSFNEIARSIYLRGRVETLPIYLWQQASTKTSNVPLIYSLNVIILIVSTAIVAIAFWLLFGRRGK